MTTQEVATTLVELCRQGEFEKAQKELYAEDAKSIEPAGSEMAGFEKEEKGLDRIMAKGQSFQSSVEAVHAITVSDPLVSGNAIALTLLMDVTFKQHGRMPLAEICVYEVKDGKIISEQFFM